VLCPLCINTGDCNYIIAGPQWKDHPHYIIAQEDLSNIDELTDINHPHFVIILMTSLSKSLEKDKEAELEYEHTKVQAKGQADSITQEQRCSSSSYHWFSVLSCISSTAKNP
jgi:hypothetical protein